MSWLKRFNGKRDEQHDPVRRDDGGQPITCDCPDGAEHPCDGKGWCRP